MKRNIYVNSCYNIRDRNLIDKEEAEKILKYKDLTIEIAVVRKNKN